MEISIHSPTQFIIKNQKGIIPEWEKPIKSIIIILQKSQFPLIEKTPLIEEEKNRLRDNFIQLGNKIISILNPQGIITEIIDPATGYPQISSPGEITHDDIKTIQILLNFPVTPYGKCKLINHPRWGNAVYPGIIMSTASPTQLNLLLNLVFKEFLGKKLEK